MPSLGLGLGTHVTRSLIDPDVAAFAAESGATDTAGLNTLTEYLKEESLYNNFVIYPMKSAQNAGSGSTVYSLGGLTGNDMTLVNSPTWGATGITYNGTTQYGHISDFLGADTITVFNRTVADSTGGTFSGLVSQYDTGANERSWFQSFASSTSIRMNRSSDGTAANLEVYGASGLTFSDLDTCLVSQWVDGGGRSLWLDKSGESLVLVSGSAQTSRSNATANVTYSCFLNSGSPTAYCKQRGIACALMTGAVTTAQRERITDLINEL